MTLVKARGDLPEQVGGVEADALEIDADLEDLLAVAHVERAADAHRSVKRTETLASLALERGEEVPQRGGLQP